MDISRWAQVLLGRFLWNGNQESSGEIRRERCFEEFKVWLGIRKKVYETNNKSKNIRLTTLCSKSTDGDPIWYNVFKFWEFPDLFSKSESEYPIFYFLYISAGAPITNFSKLLANNSFPVDRAIEGVKNFLVHTPNHSNWKSTNSIPVAVRPFVHRISLVWVRFN